MHNLLRVIALLLCATAAWAQKDTRPTEQDLAATTARGRMLAEYDVAAWHASDAVLALKPDEGVVAKYIARKTEAGWVVEFGRFTESKDAFLIVYEATQVRGTTDYKVKTYDPPKKDTGYFYFAARGIVLALENAHLANRPYNTYVLPLDAGKFYVYVVPAQTVAEVYPLGGDTRFLLSDDGTKILETRRLHSGILELKHSPADAGEKLAANAHTHILSNTPEDTDVFHVLRQTHPVPELIITDAGLYQVQTDGTITLVSPQ